jgi:hypothetical protein
MLKKLARITRPGSKIIGDALDPYATDDPLHLRYHAREEG